MKIPHLAVAALFAAAGAAHADVVTAQATAGKAATASRPDVVHTPMPAQLTLDQATPAVPARPAIPATPAVPGVSPAIPAIPAIPATPAIPAAPIAVELPPVAAAPTEVPEPSSIALLLAGALGVGVLRRRRSR